MSKNFVLPAGITIEELDEYARQKECARRRADYAKHPERVLRNRITAAVNLLERQGFTVIPPAVNAEVE